MAILSEVPVSDHWFHGGDSQSMEHQFSDTYHEKYGVFLEPEAIRKLPDHGDFLFVVAP